jgi:flavoprotein
MKQLELYAPCTARTVDQLARGLAQVLTADVLLQAGQFL